MNVTGRQGLFDQPKRFPEDLKKRAIIKLEILKVLGQAFM
jgi:hypothetical protein